MFATSANPSVISPIAVADSSYAVSAAQWDTVQQQLQPPPPSGTYYWTIGDQITSTAGTYYYARAAFRSFTVAPQYGSLQVTISPQGAIDAGAHWAVDSGGWQNSGATVSGLSAGQHTVSFQSVSGWNTPSNQNVTINANQTTTTSGTYSQQSGSLQVTISPQGAIDAGAHWAVDGNGWQNSGATVSGLSVGQHTVSFQSVSGWTTPGNQNVTINANQTTTTSGTYSQQSGSLQVSISPQGAIDAGAHWAVDGGGWQNSSATVSGLSVGQHTVSFQSVSGWTTPGNQNVTINANQTTTTSGTYSQQSGSLQVTISPQGAIDAGAHWAVDGNAWQNSGATVSGLSVGQHTVSFQSASGWTTPGNQNVTINANQTTTTSGTYSQGSGSLQVTISPQGAIDAGAHWAVDGNGWQNSGATVSGLSLGSHTLSFQDVSGWTTPGNQSPTINANQTTTTSGTYSQQLPGQYTLSLASTPSAGGSISANPPPTNETYAAGTVVQLTANPTSGYQFSSWTGDALGTSNPTTVTMSGNRSVTANFNIIPPPGTGGCCFPSGLCLENMTRADCESQVAMYLGDGSSCSSPNPPQSGDDYPAPYRNAWTSNFDSCQIDVWNFFDRQCTSFVAWRMNRDAGVTRLDLPISQYPFSNQMGLHNATNWADRLQQLGYRVDDVPAVGAIAHWTTAEVGGAFPGHVAYVRSVNAANGTIEVEEYNYASPGGNYSRRPIGSTSVGRFIHFNTSQGPGSGGGGPEPIVDLPVPQPQPIPTAACGVGLCGSGFVSMLPATLFSLCGVRVFRRRPRACGKSR